MTPETQPVDSDATRERLIAAATRLFAERGFFGASIAQIAGEVGLTKQALLYHFKRKDELYSEVIRRIGQRLRESMAERKVQAGTPDDQFVEMFIGFYEAAASNPDDVKVLMRELVDNQRQFAPEPEWHLRNTLNGIVASLDTIPGMEHLTFAEKFGRMYTAVSAVQYFIGSSVTLRRFYGEEEYAEIKANFPNELRRQLRAIVSGV